MIENEGFCKWRTVVFGGVDNESGGGRTRQVS